MFNWFDCLKKENEEILAICGPNTKKTAKPTKNRIVCQPRSVSLYFFFFIRFKGAPLQVPHFYCQNKVEVQQKKKNKNKILNEK